MKKAPTMNNDSSVLDETDELPAALQVPQSLAIGMARAEIDQQITTARAYPRSIRQVTDRIFSLATLDKESAEESMYALPRGGKPITGPSIRFAEIVKQSYGNCRAAARVVHVDRNEKFVEAEGVFHDLETNTATTARVRRRIVDSKGRLYSDDMIIVTGNAACSIALRNAIMGGVPKPLWRRAFEAVMGTIKGDITTLTENRAKALTAFAVFGVKPEQIFVALGVPGEPDITVEHIPLLRGMFATLKNGESTVEEMFGSPTAPTSEPQNLSAGFTDARAAPKKAAKAKATAPADDKASPAAEAAKPDPKPAEEAKVAASDFPGDRPAPSTTAAEPDDGGQVGDLPDDVAEGYPEAGETYHLTGDEWGEDGRRDTYKDGVPFSRAKKETGHAIYEDHAPEGPGGQVEGNVAAEAGGEEEGAALDPEFSLYIDTVEKVTSWVDVKKAMQAFYTTPLFKGWSLEQQNKVRANTWDACIDESVRKIADLPPPSADASAFRLFVQWSEDPEEIQAALDGLEKSETFAAKEEPFKDVIRQAAAIRIKELIA
jgi:hypothetical protein